MNNSNNHIKNTKDQVAGHAKEKIGDVTNNEELELKGKIQSSTADAKKNAGEMKENTAGKINNFIDDKKDNKK